MRLQHPALTVAGLIVFAACGESTSPQNFNPAATAQRASEALGAARGNQAVHSMDVMSDAFTFTSASAPWQGSAHSAGSTAGSIEALERVVLRLSAAEPQALLPAAALGKTFLYNPQTARYEVSAQTGAPSNGARFLLYAVDTTSRSVRTPLQQIGYFDLVDKSGASNTLGVKAVLGAATMLEYDATGTVGTSSFTFAAKGYVTDGTNRLDFDLSQSLSGSSGLLIDYKITAPSQGNLGIQVVATATTPTVSTATLTITEGVGRLEITANANGNNVTGTVKYSGSTLATLNVSGSGDPAFTAAGGRVLTAEELAGLRILFYLVDDLFDRFDALLVPAYFTFGLSR